MPTSLIERIEEETQRALREKNTALLETLRMLRAAIHNARIAKGKEKEFSDEDVIFVLRQEVKRRRDALLDYERGQREDLVKKTKDEIEILLKYLPPELGEEELKRLIKEKIESLRAKGQVDFARVMAEVMQEIKGKARGDVVSKIVKEMLI